MIFKHPWLLGLLLLLIPLAIWMFRKRPRATWVYSHIAPLKNMPKSLRTRFIRLPGILKLFSLGLLIVALARPQKGDEHQPVIRQGIAILMTLDRSSSMSQEDFEFDGKIYDRFTIAKKSFEDFVLGSDELPGRPDDLVGMIAFARWADTHCPLTLDHEMTGDLLGRTHTVQERYEDGTAIGEAIAAACEKLKKTDESPHPPRSKIIVLLTDGQETVSTQIKDAISPLEARDLAKTLGIKIYTIGVAPDPSVQMKNGGGLFGGLLSMTNSDVDERLLNNLAQTTGGRYFRAADGESLKEVMEEINELEKVRIEDRRYTEYSEKYLPLLLVALGALSLSFLLNETLLKRGI